MEVDVVLRNQQRFRNIPATQAFPYMENWKQTKQENNNGFKTEMRYFKNLFLTSLH